MIVPSKRNKIKRVLSTKIKDQCNIKNKRNNLLDKGKKELIFAN